MKKILSLVGALLLILPATGQKADPKRYRNADWKNVDIETSSRDSLGIDTLRRIDPTGSDLVKLREGGKDGNMILEVAGFGLTLGQTPMQKMSTNMPRVFLGMLSDTEFGFTQLTGVDYSDYAPEQRGFLDQRLGSSFHFSFSVAQLCVEVNRSRTLELSVGFQYTIDNYRLANNGITLGNADGRIVPVALDAPAKKSKAVVSALGIPVRLTYKPIRNLRITAVAYSDFVVGADAIYKKPKDKSNLSGFRTYQFGVGASVSYYGLGIYARYGLTPVFKSGAGPDAHAVSFGFSYTLNLFGSKGNKGK